MISKQTSAIAFATLLLLPGVANAVKISQLPPGVALVGTEEAPFTQSATTVKITGSQIATFVAEQIATAAAVITSSTPTVKITGTDAGATGPILRFQHNSSTPAASDIASSIQTLAGTDDEEVGRIDYRLTDGSTTTEDGIWDIYADVAGVSTRQASIGANTFVVGSADAISAFDDGGGGGRAPGLQLINTVEARASLGIGFFNNSNDAAHLELAHSRGATVGSYTTLQDGDFLAQITFQGSDGDQLIRGAVIESLVQGTPSNNVMPAVLILRTCGAACTSPQNQLFVQPDGVIQINSDQPGSGYPTSVTQYSGSTATPALQVSHDSANGATVAISRYTNDNGAARMLMTKSRGTIDNGADTYTIVNSGDRIGEIIFEAADGTDFAQAASIAAFVNGAPGAGDMPGMLKFLTSNNGAETPVERMRIEEAVNTEVRIMTADAGAAGPVFRLYHESATPANADIPASIQVNAGTDGEEIGRIDYNLLDGTTTTEDGSWQFHVDVAGVSALQASIGNGVIIGTGTTLPGAGNVSVADGAFIGTGTEEIVVFQDVATAVNQIDITNAAATGDPRIYATGGDTNIGLWLGGKGDGDTTVVPSGSTVTIDQGSGAFMSTAFYNNSTGAGGPALLLVHDTSSPANSDFQAIEFFGRDSAANQQQWGSINNGIIDVTSGSEDAETAFGLAVAGTVARRAAISDGMIIGSGTTYPGQGKLLLYTATGVQPTISGGGADTDHTLILGGKGGGTTQSGVTLVTTLIEQGSTNFSSVMIRSTSDGAGGAALILEHDTATPAASDFSTIEFFGRDSAANLQQYANFDIGISDVTSGSEDSYFNFGTEVAGAHSARGKIGNGAIIGGAAATALPGLGALLLADSAPGSGAGGQLRWGEDTDNGANYLSMHAPAAVTSNQTCLFEDDANFVPDSCVGDGTDASDARLKRGFSLAKAEMVGSMIDQIKVYDFEWNVDAPGVAEMVRKGKHGFGVKAQELYEVAPDLVKKGGDDPLTDPWTWKPEKLVPYLLVEIQHLRKRVAELESK